MHIRSEIYFCAHLTIVWHLNHRYFTLPVQPETFQLYNESSSTSNNRYGGGIGGRQTGMFRKITHFGLLYDNPRVTITLAELSKIATKDHGAQKKAKCRATPEVVDAFFD